MSLDWLEKLESKQKQEIEYLEEEQKPLVVSIKPRTPRIPKKEPLHILNGKNLIRFIQEQERTKPYEMKIRFYNSSSYEIQKLLNKLFRENKIKRNKNGWINLTKEDN